MSLAARGDIHLAIVVCQGDCHQKESMTQTPTFMHMAPACVDSLESLTVHANGAYDVSAFLLTFATYSIGENVNDGTALAKLTIAVCLLRHFELVFGTVSFGPEVMR